MRPRALSQIRPAQPQSLAFTAGNNGLLGTSHLPARMRDASHAGVAAWLSRCCATAAIRSAVPSKETMPLPTRPSLLILRNPRMPCCFPQMCKRESTHGRFQHCHPKGTQLQVYKRRKS